MVPTSREEDSIGTTMITGLLKYLLEELLTYQENVWKGEPALEKIMSIYTTAIRTKDLRQIIIKNSFPQERKKKKVHLKGQPEQGVLPEIPLDCSGHLTFYSLAVCVKAEA